jgi:putative aldouronate transport system permease protein
MAFGKSRKAAPVSKLSWRMSFQKYRLVYLMLLPAVVFVLVFSYFPMPGILVAFKNFDIFKGVFGSPWAAQSGFGHFIKLFSLPEIWTAISNTLIVSILSVLLNFPAPIILALLLNELRQGPFKKIVQSITYIPHFLSWISIIGLFIMMYSSYGPLNELWVLLKGPDTERILFLSLDWLFVPNILFLSIWQSVGWGSILYLASIAGIDQAQYESAEIDGAGRIAQTYHITIPSILPTVTIMLIFQLGAIFTSNFELIYGLQNPFIDFDVISTYVYKSGIQARNYSMATAVGLAQGVVAFLLTALANFGSKKISGVGIW